MKGNKGDKKTKVILYHASSCSQVVPKHGLGNEKHDYGKGFYLTENIDLAKEWSVCKPDKANGWVHKFELDVSELSVLDFQEHDILSWLAELMKYRDALESKRYKVLSKKFIDKYSI